ncbi:MAG: proton-gated ion channel [Thermodesulfobacteriota bacterium]|nr:MAG: proton-gated ion channel [Thermodesulfobacteriota bacterium]
MSTYSSAQGLPDAKTLPSSIEQPFEVNTGLYLMHIVKIDQPNQILSGLFEIAMLWTDDRLAFQSSDGTPKSYSGAEADKVLSTMWYPNPEIVNQASKTSIQKSNLAIFPDGSVKYRYIFSVDLLTEFDYTRFPFDDQDLRMELQSFKYNSKQLVFVPSEQYTGISSLFRSDDWIAFPMSVYTGVKRAFGFETQDRAYILYEMKLERRSQFYILQIIIPFCFFILMATSVFWIYWVSVDRRVAVTATFMLTSVAFNFLVLNYLPSVPYKTMLNTIITAGYFMGGVIIAAVITFELFKEAGRERAWVLGNKITRFVAPVVMIAVWLLIYYIFMNKDLQIVNLIR